MAEAALMRSLMGRRGRSAPGLNGTDLESQVRQRPEAAEYGQSLSHHTSFAWVVERYLSSAVNPC